MYDGHFVDDDAVVVVVDDGLLNRITLTATTTSDSILWQLLMAMEVVVVAISHDCSIRRFLGYRDDSQQWLLNNNQ